MDCSMDISQVMMASNPTHWPPLTNQKFCNICFETFDSLLDLFDHSSVHPDVDITTDMLIGGLQSILEEQIEFFLISVDGSWIKFFDTDCICRAPGCTFVGYNREELESHILRRDDPAHVCFRESCAKYGQFYGTIKAHTLIKGSLPSITELLGGHNSKHFRCKTCGALLSSSLNTVKKHTEIYHPTLINAPLSERFEPVKLLIMTHDQAMSEFESYDIDKRGAVQAALLELLNQVNKDVIDDETDKVYKSLLENDDSPVTSHISPSKIIQKASNKQSAVSIHSNLDDHKKMRARYDKLDFSSSSSSESSDDEVQPPPILTSSVPYQNEQHTTQTSHFSCSPSNPHSSPKIQKDTSATKFSSVAGNSAWFINQPATLRLPTYQSIKEHREDKSTKSSTSSIPSSIDDHSADSCRAHYFDKNGRYKTPPFPFPRSNNRQSL